jgi:hypothetical protein
MVGVNAKGALLHNEVCVGRNCHRKLQEGGRSEKRREEGGRSGMKRDNGEAGRTEAMGKRDEAE